MPLATDDNDQSLVPTGIHWQVSQACSLQNLVFNMPSATDNEKATHVGIFMENGSGGFVSDLASYHIKIYPPTTLALTLLLLLADFQRW